MTSVGALPNLSNSCPLPCLCYQNPAQAATPAGEAVAGILARGEAEEATRASSEGAVPGRAAAPRAGLPRLSVMRTPSLHSAPSNRQPRCKRQQLTEHHEKQLAEHQQLLGHVAGCCQSSHKVHEHLIPMAPHVMHAAFGCVDLHGAHPLADACYASSQTVDAASRTQASAAWCRPCVLLGRAV
jgi:hypothetical protein